MKIYTNTFDLSRPAPHRFWVPPYSDFKIGIKLVNAGVELENDFTVAAGTTELIAYEAKIDGFTIYTLNSTDTGFVEYTITVDGLLQKLKLVQIVSDSTVFDIDERGGDMSQYATKNWVQSEISGFVDEDALSAYYTKSETSSATEIGTALEGKQPTGDYALTSQIPTVNDGTLTITQGGVLKGTFTANQSGNVSVELDAGAGGGAISAFDMSESPVWSKTMVENAVKTNVCLPQTIVKYTDGSLSCIDISGTWLSSTIEQSVKPTIKGIWLGTNLTAIGPSGIGKIDGQSQNWNNLETIIIPDTVTNYAVRSFFGLDKVKRVEIPQTATGAGPGDFFAWANENSLTSISFGQLSSLGTSTVYNNGLNSLVEVNLGNNLKSIGSQCFYGSRGLGYILIPDSVTTIENRAFCNAGISSVTGKLKVDFGNTRTTIPTISTGSSEWNRTFESTAEIYVPDALYDTWIAASIWSNISSQIHRHSELEAPYATSKAEDAYSTAEAAQLGLGSKVDHFAGGTAPEVLNIISYYESEYTQLSVDDPSWEPDQTTMYVILPDPVVP